VHVVGGVELAAPVAVAVPAGDLGQEDRSLDGLALAEEDLVLAAVASAQCCISLRLIGVGERG
jgi:hypothetical protein